MAKDKEIVFSKKFEKYLPSGFKDVAESMDEEELRKTVVDAHKNISELEKELDDDQRLTALKEEVRTIAGGFKDTINAFQSKAKYCIYLLRTRGNL